MFYLWIDCHRHRHEINDCGVSLSDDLFNSFNAPQQIRQKTRSSMISDSELKQCKLAVADK